MEEEETKSEYYLEKKNRGEPVGLFIIESRLD
jgi:hypothetical protein